LPQLKINAKQLRGSRVVAMKYEHLELVGYKSHGKIAAPVAV
jgi:thymidylate synthase